MSIINYLSALTGYEPEGDDDRHQEMPCKADFTELVSAGLAGEHGQHQAKPQAVDKAEHPHHNKIDLSLFTRHTV